MAGTAGIQYPLVVQWTQSAIGAVANNYVMTRAASVIDAWAVVTTNPLGAATLTIGNGANAITNALNVNAAVNSLVRTANLTSANQAIAAAGSLRFTTSNAASQVTAWALLLPAVSNATTV